MILHYFLLKLFRFTKNAYVGRLGKGNSNLELRVKKRSSAAEGKANEELSSNNIYYMNINIDKSYNPYDPVSSIVVMLLLFYVCKVTMSLCQIVTLLENNNIYGSGICRN